MTTTPAPEVEFLFDAINDNHSKVGVAIVGISPVGGDLSQIPLERIDRDNSNNIDGTWTHVHSEDPEEMNFFSAALTSRPEQPIGTEYDLMGDAVVSCQILGMGNTNNTFGAIDMGTDVSPSVSYPTCEWGLLNQLIRNCINFERKYPDVGRSNTSYKDLFIENWTDNSQQYSDWFFTSFDVVFSGFETLP